MRSCTRSKTPDKVYLNRLFQRLFLTLEEELKRSHLEATEEAVILPLTNTVAR